MTPKCDDRFRLRCEETRGRWGLLLALLITMLLPGALRAEGDVAEVERCLNENLPDKTLMQDASITSLDRTGADRTQTARIYSALTPERRARMLVSVETPPDLRGSSYLLIQQEDRNDMWVYLPELRKVRRVSGRTVSGSLFGTDFSYEDMQHLQTLGRSMSATRLPDAEYEGRKVYVVDSTPDLASGSAYSKIVHFIDQERCVPLKTEFYEEGELRKVLTAKPDKVTLEEGSWVPRDLTIRDLRDETQSRLVVENVEIDTQPQKRRFSLTKLERGR